jgi:hypothetical protein
MSKRKQEIKAFSEEQREKTISKYTKLSMDMRKDLLERLDLLSNLYPRGFKTDAINKGLEIIVEELEELNKEDLKQISNMSKEEIKAYIETKS